MEDLRLIRISYADETVWSEFVGIIVDDVTLAVKSSASNDRVDNSIGNNPCRQRSKNGDVVFTLFRRTRASDDRDGNPFIYALKGKDDYSIAMNEVKKFVPFLHHFIQGLRAHLACDVVMPVPSYHGISSIIAKRISRALCIPFHPCGFVKKRNSLVASEINALLRSSHLHRNTQRSLRRTVSLIKKKPNAEFALKNVYLDDRKYVQPFLWDASAGVPTFRSVVLVDDLLATGQSFSSMRGC